MPYPTLKPFELDPLPYPYDALEPVISMETLEYHHDKHHQGYVDKLNELIPGSGYEGASLMEILMKSTGPIQDQAAQHWNHDFYWKSMSGKKGIHAPEGDLLKAINLSFGSFQNFRMEFEKTASSLFGSGWLWLTSNSYGTIQLILGKNAENPIRHGLIPLLACDLWEHAYYIDYRNSRNAYVAVFLEVMDWRFAAENYAAGLSSQKVA